MDLNNGNILRPVILPVPSHVRQWHARDRVVFLSRHARKALRLSARRCDLELGELTKDDRGVPLPSNGFYWSITHKPRYVAAVVSPDPVGIDLEEIRAIQEGLYRRVAGAKEWRLVSGSGRREDLFFRFWTAKEAVMKAAGTGIKDLSRIKIRQVAGEKDMVLAFQQREWKVQQRAFDNHIAAVAARDFEVEWPAAQNP